jgi:hypothetical protein
VVERDGRRGVVSWDWMTDRARLAASVTWATNAEHLVRLVREAEAKLPPTEGAPSISAHLEAEFRRLS